MKEVKYPSSASALPSDTTYDTKYFVIHPPMTEIMRHNQSRHEKRRGTTEKAPALFERPQTPSMHSFFVLRPIATSVDQEAQSPKVRTSTRYTSRKSPPPSFAHEYGNRRMLPAPARHLPPLLWARTNPIEPLELCSFFHLFLSPLPVSSSVFDLPSTKSTSAFWQMCS